MADVPPLKIGYNSNGVASGLSEFRSGDSISIAAGGTGVSSTADLSSTLGLEKFGGTFDHITNTSALWHGTYTHVTNTSSTWGGAGGDHGGLTGLADNDHPQYLLSATYDLSSGNFKSAYDHVLATSANWTGTYNHILNTSAGWEGAENHLNSVSANWEGTYDHMLATSAFWEGAGNHLNSVSANWEGTFDHVGATSSVWDNTDHGALTGMGDDDHPQYLKSDGSRNVQGSIGVSTNLTVSGTVNVSGDVSSIGDININGLPYPRPYAAVIVSADLPAATAEHTITSGAIVHTENEPFPDTTQITWQDSTSRFIVCATGTYKFVCWGVTESGTNTTVTIRIRQGGPGGTALNTATFQTNNATDLINHILAWTGSLTAGDTINATIQSSDVAILGQAGTMVEIERIR